MSRMLKQQRDLMLDTRGRNAMRKAGQANAALMDHIRPHIQAGVATIEIDNLVHQWTKENGHRPATLGYQGYPKSCCISINEVICR